MNRSYYMRNAFTFYLTCFSTRSGKLDIMRFKTENLLKGLDFSQRVMMELLELDPALTICRIKISTESEPLYAHGYVTQKSKGLRLMRNGEWWNITF